MARTLREIDSDIDLWNEILTDPKCTHLDDIKYAEKRLMALYDEAARLIEANASAKINSINAALNKAKEPLKK